MSDSAAAAHACWRSPASAQRRSRPRRRRARAASTTRRSSPHTPNHARALAELANMDLQSIGSAEQAQARLDRALATAPGLRPRPPRAGARATAAQARRARRPAKSSARRKAPKAAPRQCSRRWAEVQRRRGDHAGALESLARAHRAEATPQRALALVDAWLRAGQRDAAQSLLHELEQVAPFERAPRLRLAKLQRASSQLDDAVATLGRWLTICPEDDEALVELARVHGIAGRVDQQKELLRTALDLNKNLRNERRYLDFLEAEEKPFYDAYRLDADQVIGADRGPPADAAKANDPLHYLLRQPWSAPTATAPPAPTSTRSCACSTTRRASSSPTTAPPYSGRAARALLSCTDRQRRTARCSARRCAAGRRPCRTCAAGDVVLVEGRIDDLAPSFFGDYFGNSCTRSGTRGQAGGARRALVVLDPGRQYLAGEATASANPPRHRRSPTARCSCAWRCAPAARRARAAPPGTERIAPLVRMTTYRDWDQFAQWWWNLIKKQLEVTPAMRATVRELCGGRPRRKRRSRDLPVRHHRRALRGVGVRRARLQAVQHAR
jgi:hypothetical protein